MKKERGYVLFYVLFAFDAVFVSVLIFFFLAGLRYASDGYAQGLWLLIIGAPVALLIGAWRLKAAGCIKSAIGLLGAVALAPLLYIAFFAAILIVEPNWH